MGISPKAPVFNMNQVSVWVGRLFSATGQQRLAWSLVALCLLPFVVLGFNSHPSLDDFSDMVMRRHLSFWGAQQSLYLGWTGRFATSVLLMELSPLRWPGWPSFYFLVPLGSLLALAGGLFTLFTKLTREVWPMRMRALATGVVLSLWLLQAPSVAECLYWYNAVAVYSLPDALFLLWVATMVGLVQSRRDVPGYLYWWTATAGLSVLLIGSNEVVALVVLAGLTGATLWAGLRHSAHLVPLLGLLVLAIVAAALSFLAPGNMARLTVIEHQVHLGRAIMGAIGSSAYLIINWLGNGLVLVATALALPALSRLAAQSGIPTARLRQVHPLALAIGLLGLLVLTGMPSYWATGGMMPLRARTAVYLLFLLGWLVLVVSSLSWAKWQWPGVQVPTTWPLPVASLLWGWLLLSFVSDHNVRVEHVNLGRGSNNVIVAYRDWLSGAAGHYDAQQRARYRQLQSAPAQRLRLAPLVAEPPTLVYYDITTDSTYWGNSAYAQFFGQRTIWIGPGGHAPPL